jgi:BASS family bile acid:Na+ symporter
MLELLRTVVAPLVMILLLRVVPLDPALQAGLLVFSLCAGAPFLIKLTQLAEHHVALGAAVMFLLMVITVPYVPLVLPRRLTAVSVDSWAITRSLLLQIVVPTALGMALARWLPGPARPLQPWAARVAGLTLYAVIAATVIGYFPNMRDIVGTGAILVLLAFVVAALGAGDWAGAGRDHYEDVGALGTAQRNTAAGLIIAERRGHRPRRWWAVSSSPGRARWRIRSPVPRVRRDQPWSCASADGRARVRRSSRCSTATPTTSPRWMGGST